MAWSAIPAVSAVLLLAAAPATAAAPERGLVVGERVFGTPACGVPHVVRGAFADPALLGGSDPQACEIVLNRRYARRMAPEMRCTVVLHEYGHLAGHGHSADPDSVMSAEYAEPDERCVNTALRGRRTSGSARGSG